MSSRAMFLTNVESAAKRHGFSFQTDEERISMSKRDSAGDDEPSPAVIASARALAKDIAQAYPALREMNGNGIEMLFIDEWVDLVIYPNEVIFFDQKEQKIMRETKQYGMLASQAGYQLPLEVLKSNAGFYIGTSDCGPVSRESVEYWPTIELAQEALDTRNWTQKQNP